MAGGGCDHSEKDATDSDLALQHDVGSRGRKHWILAFTDIEIKKKYPLTEDTRETEDL